MQAVHQLSAILFIVTGALLIAAEVGRARRIGRIAAMLSFVTVLGADALLLMDVPQVGGLWEPSGRVQAKKKGGGGGDGDDEEEPGEHADSGGSGRRNAAAGSSGDSAAAEMARVAAARVNRALAGWTSLPPVNTDRLPGAGFKDCPDCPDLVVIPAGRARNAEIAAPMSEATDRSAATAVWPGFAIGRRELGRAEFDRFVAATGHAAKPCVGRPIASVLDTTFSGSEAHEAEAAVGCVTWDDAVAYVTWLSRRTGHHYRLATATEWLYASDLAPSLPDAPRSLGGGDAAAGLAEIVSDCWRHVSGVLAVSERGSGQCSAHTVVDVPRDADQSGGSILPRLPIAAGASSPVIGFRVVRTLD